MEPHIEETNAAKIRHLSVLKAEDVKKIGMVGFDFDFYKKVQKLVYIIFPKSFKCRQINRISGDTFSFFRDGEISTSQMLGIVIMAGHYNFDIKIRPFGKLSAIIYIKRKEQNYKDFKALLLSYLKSVEEL